MKGLTVLRNKDRYYFITRDEADKVIGACPDDEWKLIFALARYGGLRCPSEHMALRWRDIDWTANRITIHCVKTEHHGDEHAVRVIPLFPELRPHLEAARDAANPGFDTPLSDPVITRYRDAKTNLRTQLRRIIKLAKLKVWPKLFQNLRSTRQTELAEFLPSHVVCAFMGNSERVADQHYLQVTDAHFDAACSALHNPVQHTAASSCMEMHTEKSDTEKDGRNNMPCIFQSVPMGDEGLEPPTFAV